MRETIFPYFIKVSKTTNSVIKITIFPQGGISKYIFLDHFSPSFLGQKLYFEVEVVSQPYSVLKSSSNAEYKFCHSLFTFYHWLDLPTVQLKSQPTSKVSKEIFKIFFSLDI